MGALKVFTELFQLSDDAHLDMGTVTAAVEAMGWVVGKANMKAWEEVRGFVIVLLDRSIGYTAGGLRHVVDALAVRTGETSHLIARKCAVVLECAAFPRNTSGWSRSGSRFFAEHVKPSCQKNRHRSRSSATDRIMNAPATGLLPALR